MVPEISHRCSSCGATIRDADALFCPECGKSLAQTEAKSQSQQSDQTAVAEAAAQTPSSEPRPESQPAKTDAGAAPHQHRIGDKTRERLHRASEVARGVIEDEVKRVEKIRHASTTVIEEASYDPSLRFVLVALGLFIVFVILLVLSKVMG